MKFTLVSIAAALTLLLLTGCDDSEDEDKATLDEMSAEILNLIEDNSCLGSKSCKYIGFGSKPCGGPWRYLIYSNENVNEDELRAKVSEYNEFEDEMNRKYGYVSDCSVPEIPEPACIDGRCINAG